MSRITQAAYVLLKQSPTPDQISASLDPQGLAITKHERGTDLLTAATASVVFEVPFQAENGSSVLIDVMNHRWVDTIDSNDPVLFLSWHSGALGHFAYPGCLERAIHECRTWPEVDEAVKNHTALLRLRVSYKEESDLERRISAAGKQDLAFAEIVFLTKLLLVFASLPETLGYFLPGGEALVSREMLPLVWQQYMKNEPPRPFDLWIAWMNRRLLRVPDEADWAVIDTIGLHQLEMNDLEACFQPVRYQPLQVANWLLDVASYLYTNGPIIQDGHTLTGPGGINWQAHSYESSLQFPPRSVLCLRPLDAATLPQRLLKRLPIPPLPKRAE